MYINKVDDLIDKVIDEFSTQVILSDKRIKSILKEPNFVKYQKDINDLLVDYIKTIPRSKIETIVKKGDSINSIYNTLKKYVTIYLFLFIGFNYNSKDDTYINNVIEFSKNQSNHNFKINNFFNSESNAALIEYYYIIKNLVTLFDQAQPKLSSIERLPHGKETIDFVSQLDSDFMRENFMIKNKNDQSHNIIKTLIVLLIYRVNEKKDFYKMLELSETEDGEYIFIDVVRPTQQYVDFSTVESLLNQEDILNNLAYDLWDYLGEIESNAQQLGKSNEDKILNLINSGILIPIVDDFLLYHKDTEKYDRNINENDVKKKEDTKVRYIINKIDSVAELHSENVKKDPKILSNIKKHFYVPLHDRKAILRNELEEIKIINKFLNQGKRNIENNEYFNDLVNYRNYPFVNFKEFKGDGFSLTCNKTVNLVRSVSFENHGEFKQNPRNKLQFRAGSDEMIINVVGFMIPTNTKHMKCLKINETQDIRNMSKNKNGVDLMSQFIKKTIVDDETYKSSVYWLFDTKTDTVKTHTYEQAGKNSKHELIKSALSELYDKLLVDIYYKIVDEIEKMDKITLQKADKIIMSVQKRLLAFSDRHDLIDDLENFIYTKKLLTDDVTYDENDDILFGLTGNIHELSDNPLKDLEPIPRLTINPEKLDELGQQEEVEVVVGVCQHNITWDDISKKKRSDPKSYMEDIFRFIQQYVTENHEGDYICKSCGFQLNIKKYVTDGTFDNDTQRFITYSMPMEIPLEDILEYEKYKPSIKILDKIVEKIASIVNISHLVGSNTTTKWKRKAIIKNVIDTILLNNSYLKNKFKERNDKANTLYGINRNSSNLFVFDMDNSIFQFSSKDKDQYKPIKMNNIIAYIVMYLLLDLNDTHIGFLSTDKKFFCDFEFFDKYYKILYDNTKFLKNDKMDVVDVTKHKIFCYALYMISCKLAKHRLWNFDSDTSKTVSKKKIPLVQKSVMHTVIDLINSVLENSFKENTNYELEIFRTKFYEKLSTIFSDNEIYLNLKNDGKITTVSENKNYIMIQANITKSEYTGPKKFDKEHKFVCCRQHRFYMPYGKKLNIEFSKLNVFTNCDDGEFHKWKPMNKTFTCSHCKVKMNSLIGSSNKENVSLIKNFKIKNLMEISKIYCNDGSIHQFIDDENGKRKCIKCGETDTKAYTHDELLKMEKNIRTNQLNDIESTRHLSKKIELLEKEDDDYINKVIDKTTTNMEKNITKDNKFKYIEKFINDMEKIIGNDKNILKNSRLKENIYTIDHDHVGYTLNNPIIITDSDKKIFFKQNHKHFETDVLYYTNYKSGKVDVFYDAITKILLGYKEESKNYVNYGKADKKLKVDYSIYNKLMLLGYESQYLDINDNFESVTERFDKLDQTEDNKQKMYRIIAFDIIKSRHSNIKKTIADFYRVFNRIINNFKVQKRHKDDNVDIDEESYFTDKMGDIVIKHTKKLSNVIISEPSGRNRILKHWKSITRGIKPESLKDIYFSYSDKLIDVNTITSYDNKGNLMLFYLVNEMNNLITFNDNKFTKMNIVIFLIDFINTAFELFNVENLMNNKDIKRFTYVLKSSFYMRNLEEKEDINKNTGIYEEYTDPDEELSEEQLEILEDAIEEQDALDMESDIDYEEAFDNAMNWEPSIDMDSLSVPSAYLQ